MATRKRRTTLIVLASIAALLIIARIILPYVVLHYANRELERIPGYYGHIQDIDIHLIRGAYEIDSIYLNKRDTVTKKQTEFFGARQIDLSVQWAALWKGRIVGELTLTGPTLVFTKEKTEPKHIAKDTTSFRKLLNDFMPLDINRVEITQGAVQYKDHTSTPKVDLQLSDLYVLALNLRNTEEKGVLLPSTINAHANLYKGYLDFKMKLNALKEKPTFDLNATLNDAHLVPMNDFFKAYGNFDVNKGTLGLYTEFAAQKGRFKGYVKPVIKDLDVRGPEDKKDTFFQKVWESLVGAGGVVVKNPKHKQVATKLPVEGRFDNPDILTYEAVIEVLRNAFIEALHPSIDQDITIKSAVKPEDKPKKKGFFKRVFGKKDKSGKK